MAESNGTFLGYHPDAELVFGIVCPLGTDHHNLVQSLSDYLLNHFGYTTHLIRLSDRFPALLKDFSISSDGLDSNDQEALARGKIEAGNLLRKKADRQDFLALVAAGDVAMKRFQAFSDARSSETNAMPAEWKRPLPKVAHIITTLKRPEEVATLRRIYGGGFFLIGFAATKSEKNEYFRRKNISDERAKELVKDDRAEDSEWGQRTSETFQLSDVFISVHDHANEIMRFLNLLFGSPKETPTPEEHAMFMAYSAALRSGDLSRQVGAALVDSYGDLLAIGFNEVPKSGGGPYAPGPASQRDIERGEDSNEIARRQIMSKVLEVLNISLPPDEAIRKLKQTGLGDLTEYGRSVHAEMQALFTCARTGRSTRDATLFTTTFPCHNCCRHIIAAGIRRVVYIEPYPKSWASSLHSDAISEDDPMEGKIPFEAFVGVGPRRFFDLFSLTLSAGYVIERKKDGKLSEWQPINAAPRLQLQPTSYLDHEILALETVKKLRLKSDA